MIIMIEVHLDKGGRYEIDTNVDVVILTFNLIPKEEIIEELEYKHTLVLMDKERNYL